MTQVIVNGNAYSDDGGTSRDMQGGGVQRHLLPMIGDTILEVKAHKAAVQQVAGDFGNVGGAIAAAEQAKLATEQIADQFGNVAGAIAAAETAKEQAETAGAQATQNAGVAAAEAALAQAAKSQAETARTQAQGSSSNATSAAAIAGNAATRAELARDSAILNAGLYGSASEALAAGGGTAVAINAVFAVAASGAVAVQFYRRTGASTYTLLTSMSSESYVAALAEKQARQAVTYASVAAGLAAVAAGEEFLVKGSGSASETRHKKLSATTSQELASNAATQAVQALQGLIAAADSAKRAFDFVDLFDRVIATLFADGLFQTRALQLQGSDAPVEGGEVALAVHDKNGFVPVSFDALQSNLYGVSIRPAADGSIALVDNNGFVLFYVGPRGIIGGSTTTAVPSAVSAVKLGAQVRTDVMHAACFGQSLSRGLLCDAISLAQLYGNLMLAAGVKALPGEAAYNPAAFAPLLENVVGDEGETPVAGALNGLVRRVVSGGGVAEQWVFLGSSSGKGGQQVEQLSPGGNSGRFEQTLQIIRDAKALCDTQGKSYSVWAMHWYQGENNYSATASDRDAFDYQQRWLTKLWQTMQAEILRITGQQFLPYLFTYQVAAHRRYAQDHIQIALAQWRASKAYDDVVLTAPCYIFRTNADNLHLTAESSWLMGEYTARAMHQTMIQRGGKWRPLEPVAVDWQPTQIKVKFHVPAGQLVIDNALAATYENAGFILRNGTDAVIAGGITAVAVTARDEITITTAPGIPADAKLTYARGKPGDAAHSGPVTGGRGNVRDTAGLFDKATSPLGNEFALHNACVMFEYSRAVGF